MFSSSVGTPLDADNVRRAFKKITTSAGLGRNWKPLELRTSFVSLMSQSGVPVEQIARLVAHGLTNREIADRLFISERTAEGHIEQIRNKLGFSSRVQIAAWLVEQQRAGGEGG